MDIVIRKVQDVPLSKGKQDMKVFVEDHISPCKHNQERKWAMTLVCLSGVAPCYSSMNNILMII